MSSYIYQFHMALFFCLSGYLTTIKDNMTFAKFFKHKAKTILLPYFILFWISLFYGHIILKYVFDINLGSFHWIKTIKGLVLSGGDLIRIPTCNFPLWFLPNLFVSFLFFYIILKLTDEKMRIPVLILVGILIIPIQNYIHGFIPERPPFHMDIIPSSIFFMLLGNIYRKYEEKIKVNAFILIGIFLFNLYVVYYYPSGISNINALYLFTASGSIYLYYQIAQNFKQCSALAYIGKNSMIIYGLHALIQDSFKHLKLYEFLEVKWNGMFIAFIITILTIVIGCFIVFVVQHVKIFLKKEGLLA